MKKIIVLFLFFSFTLTFAQKKMVRVPKVEITFLDGTIKNGFGYVKKDAKIVYRREKDDKKTIYDHTTVEKVTTKYNTTVRHLEYKIVKDGSKQKIMLLETGTYGNVCMYYNYKAPIFKKNSGGGYFVPVSNGSGFSSMYVGGKSYGGTNDDGLGRIKYYLAKKDSKFVERVKHTDNIYHKKFKVLFETYFSDCEKLKVKYEGKDFHKGDFEAIINFYNYRCNLSKKN